WVIRRKLIRRSPCGRRVSGPPVDSSCHREKCPSRRDFSASPQVQGRTPPPSSSRPQARLVLFVIARGRTLQVTYQTGDYVYPADLPRRLLCRVRQTESLTVRTGTSQILKLEPL